MSNKTVVASFGRGNPPHLGHLKLIVKVLEESIKIGADRKCFWSNTHNDKNPLTPEQKKYFIEKIFPPYKNYQVFDKDITDLFSVVRKLDTYDHLIFVCGNDRIEEYTERLEHYNGIEYNFDSINVISAGERNTDLVKSINKLDFMGIESSSTIIRCMVKVNDKSSFNEMYNWSPSELSDELWEVLRYYQGDN